MFDIKKKKLCCSSVHCQTKDCIATVCRAIVPYRSCSFRANYSHRLLMFQILSAKQRIYWLVFINYFFFLGRLFSGKLTVSKRFVQLVCGSKFVCLKFNNPNSVISTKISYVNNQYRNPVNAYTRGRFCIPWYPGSVNGHGAVALQRQNKICCTSVVFPRSPDTSYRIKIDRRREARRETSKKSILSFSVVFFSPFRACTLARRARRLTCRTSSKSSTTHRMIIMTYFINYTSTYTLLV